MEERAALAACRGLHAAGYRVAGAASARPAAGHWSRACAERLLLPDARSDPSGFAAGVESALHGSPAVLLPAIEASLLAVSEHRDRLEPLARIGLPAPDAVERSVDKVFQLEQARRLGVDPPATAIVAGAAEAGAAAAELGFPLVVKPARSVLRAAGVRRQRTVALVDDAMGLGAVAGDFGAPFLLQRYVGDRALVSCSGVFADGAFLALTAARVRRTFPARAGAFCFAETVAPAGQMAEATGELLRAVGWQGIFQADFLVGAPAPALIDLNARPFGAMALDQAAGANLPALWCDWLLGREPAPVRGRPGVRFRWEEGDVRHALWQLRRGRPGRAAAALRPHRRTTHAFFAATDPAPILARPVALARARLGQPSKRTSVRPTTESHE